MGVGRTSFGARKALWMNCVQAMDSVAHHVTMNVTRIDAMHAPIEAFEWVRVATPKRIRRTRKTSVGIVQVRAVGSVWSASVHRVARKQRLDSLARRLLLQETDCEYELQ